MEIRKLVFENGVYSAKIDITVEEWKKLLNNKDIFEENSLYMIKCWYNQIDYQGTTKEILIKIGRDKNPFNGIVGGLAKRIKKYLNRFEVIGTDGAKTAFIYVFEGWHEFYEKGGKFVWKLRDELVQAIKELNLFDDVEHSILEDIESFVEYPKNKEGKKIGYFSYKYERNNKNRDAAIKIHGTKCRVCGFDFYEFYGDLGKNYIEVHHIKPLFKDENEVIINPKEDLITVCSNCHRMIHRRKDNILSPEELKNIIENRVK